MSHVFFMSSDPVLKEKNLEILRQNGFDATGAAECLQGLVMLDKEDFDVIVIDDELTDASGYEACLKVRQQSDTPVILLGTVAESEVWSRVEDLGFDLYIRKPVSPRELMARIKALLRRPVMEKKSLPTMVTATKPAEPATPIQQPVTGVTEQPKEPPAQQPVKPTAQQPQPTPSMEKVPDEPHDLKTAPQLPLQQQIEGEPQAVPARPSGAVPDQSQTGAPPVTPPPVQHSQEPVTNIPLVQQAPVKQPTVIPPLDEIRIQPGPVHSLNLPPIQQARAPQPAPVTRQYREPQPVTVPPLQGQQIPPQSGMLANAQPSKQAASLTEETGINVLEDARIVKLVDALVAGKLADITPVIDFNYKGGYAYPAVDSLLDTAELETVNILEALSKSEILIKQPYERFYVDPDGLFQLVPVEHCPRCDSSNLVKGQLVEHFSCGFVGLDRDFKQESRYVCPKCRKDLRLIGTDYRNIGIHYRCGDCAEVFTTPVIKWRNLKTRREWNADELREMEVYSYRFSPDKKGWLEFQLKPKNQLVDFLRRQNYQVQELAQLTGKSGAVHTFDILAVRDDILTKINMGIGILVANTGESEVGLEALFRFDTRAYDTGINYKVVIAIPKLGQEAINFANRQMIRAFEARTLASVVSDITSTPHAKISLQSSLEADYHPDAQGQLGTGNASAVIERFLRSRGYEVYEKALIVGKSGIEHVFDIFARKDDRVIVPTLAIGVASNPSGQPVGMDEMAMFDAAAFDSGIRNKVFIGIPQISEQARQFAKQQKIDIIEQQDMGKLT
ncbi:MAG: response regulator [Dehalococcoidia bacterium]|nr:response regulator [Dehalococcoidia bacterium]